MSMISGLDGHSIIILRLGTHITLSSISVLDGATSTLYYHTETNYTYHNVSYICLGGA